MDELLMKFDSNAILDALSCHQQGTLATLEKLSAGVEETPQQLVTSSERLLRSNQHLQKTNPKDYAAMLVAVAIMLTAMSAYFASQTPQTDPALN